jgi:aspartate ammonia-lyase
LIAQKAIQTGRSVPDLVLEAGLLDEARLAQILRPEVLTQPFRAR